MNKQEKAKEIRKYLLDMIARAKKDCREFDENEQQEFDKKKNELLALAEEIKATQDKLDDMEDEIPSVDDMESDKMDDADDMKEDKMCGDKPCDESDDMKEDKMCGDKPCDGPKKEEKMGDEMDENQENGQENDPKNDNPENPEINNENTESEEQSPETPANSDEDKNKNIKRNITKIMTNDFSILKAIRSVVNRTEMPATEAAVIAEGEKQMRAAGLNAAGKILIPGETREVTVSNDVFTVNTAKDGEGNTIATGEHDDVVQTEFQSILEPLYAQSALSQAGVTFLRGLTNDVQIPIMERQNVGWAGEIDAAAKTTATFKNKKMSPKRLTAYTDISKQMLAQDSLSVEAAIRADIVNALNDKLEATILGFAAGDDTKPAGIGYNKSAVPVTTYTALCDFEAGLEKKNLFGDAKYIASPGAKAVFRAMPQSSKSTRLVMEGGEIDGTPVVSTTNVADKEFYYGLFNNVYVGQWGAVEVIVDEYTQAVNGCIRLVINAYFDEIVVRPDAILRGKVTA